MTSLYRYGKDKGKFISYYDNIFCPVCRNNLDIHNIVKSQNRRIIGLIETLDNIKKENEELKETVKCLSMLKEAYNNG